MAYSLGYVSLARSISGAIPTLAMRSVFEELLPTMKENSLLASAKLHKKSTPFRSVMWSVADLSPSPMQDQSPSSITKRQD